MAFWSFGPQEDNVGSLVGMDLLDSGQNMDSRENTIGGKTVYFLGSGLELTRLFAKRREFFSVLWKQSGFGLLVWNVVWILSSSTRILDPRRFRTEVSVTGHSV